MYLFPFQTSGGKLRGNVAVEVVDRKQDAEFTLGKITGDTVSLVETLTGVSQFGFKRVQAAMCL
jgi:hypothetical protein